ncbi:MAG: hypothetical protein JWO94_2365 [Verrucomicrobiaceae bacterium]|nr:hypothetical protein [Verrucomicrobiaceae bacterium]
MLRDAFAYPCYRQGWLILLTGMLLGTTSAVFAAHGRDGYNLFHLWLCLVFAVFYVGVIEATVEGLSRPLAWLLSPNCIKLHSSRSMVQVDRAFGFVLVLRAAIVSVVPAMVYFIIVPLGKQSEFGMQVCEWLGPVYFSMAMLTDVVRDRTVFLLPHHVLPAIARTWPGYLVVTALFCLLKMLYDHCLPWAQANPWTVMPATLFCALWLLIAHARLLGLFYLKYRTQLRW